MAKLFVSSCLALVVLLAFAHQAASQVDVDVQAAIDIMSMLTPPTTPSTPTTPTTPSTPSTPLPPREFEINI